MTIEKHLFHVLKDRSSNIAASKNKNVFLGEKKAPAGMLSRSSVLLRGMLCVYMTKAAILYFQKIGMSLLGREEAPAGALTPSTVLFCLYNI